MRKRLASPPARTPPTAGPGGGKRLDDPDVADILFDLKRRETRAYAHIFSRGLVDNLRGAAKLNHNPERSAGFVVLKAPEFPSVLVELGYLSNAQDVQSLTSPEWRAKTAAAMVRAIDAFFAGPGSRTASRRRTGVALTGGQAGRAAGRIEACAQAGAPGYWRRMFRRETRRS